MAISPSASGNIANTIANYAQRSNLSLDDIRQNPSAHRGNLRAELMQATGDTQSFSAPLVDELMSGLKGAGAVDPAVVQRAVSFVLDAQHARQQDVQRTMGATLNASQGGQSRNTQSSPLTTRMGAMMGTQHAREPASSPATTGAAAGQQAAGIGKKFGKWIKGGAIALAIGAALTTGLMTTQLQNFSPDMPERTPIELIQQQDKEAQHQGLVSGGEPAQVVLDEGTLDGSKEAAHQQSVQGRGEVLLQDLSGQQNQDLRGQQEPLEVQSGSSVDKDAAHQSFVRGNNR